MCHDPKTLETWVLRDRRNLKGTRLTQFQKIWRRRITTCTKDVTRENANECISRLLYFLGYSLRIEVQILRGSWVTLSSLSFELQSRIGTWIYNWQGVRTTRKCDLTRPAPLEVRASTNWARHTFRRSCGNAPFQTIVGYYETLSIISNGDIRHIASHFRSSINVLAPLHGLLPGKKYVVWIQLTMILIDQNFGKSWICLVINIRVDLIAYIRTLLHIRSPLI